MSKLDALSGIPIQVDPHMVGARRAIRFGNGPIIVSQAMYDLIRHADEAELKNLLESIELQQMPALPFPSFGPVRI